MNLSTTCSARGRGGHSTTFTSWASVRWNFGTGIVSATQLAAAPPVSATFSATDSYGDRVYNTGTAAYLVVPAPAAPTGVTAVQAGDQFQVGWTPNVSNLAAITSSTLTAGWCFCRRTRHLTVSSQRQAVQTRQLPTRIW